MMLHRHFENGEINENMTKLRDVSRPEKGEDFVSEIFPPDENTERSKRGRKKKIEE